LIGISIVAGSGLGVDLKINEAPRVIRLEPCRRFAHDVQVEIVHARLVQDHMRKFRQPVFNVLDPAAADDVASLGLVGLPERRLIDPVRLLQEALAKSKSVEHLHGATGDPIGLAKEQGTGFLLNDPGVDFRKCRQLRRQG